MALPLPLLVTPIALVLAGRTRVNSPDSHIGILRVVSRKGVKVHDKNVISDSFETCHDEMAYYTMQIATCERKLKLNLIYRRSKTGRILTYYDEDEDSEN